MRNNLTGIVTIVLLVFIQSCKSPGNFRSDNETQIPFKTLVWNDEFDIEGFPDSTKWSYDVDGNVWAWGNNEDQYYTEKRKENAWVSDGILKITVRKEKWEDHSYTSARLRTVHKGDWQYGRFEIRAKLPRGRGVLPCIWMLPTDWAYGKWPESGEIDIMNNFGFDPDTIVGTVHTLAYNHTRGTEVEKSIFIPDCHERFHTYVLEWEEQELRIFVDDLHYFTYTNDAIGHETWPFNKAFHLLLNVAVGGSSGGLHGVDDSVFPQILEVDYVRVYQ